MVLLTGEDTWPYLGGQGTNLGVASIVPPKPDDGGCNILCSFILCFRCALGVYANFLVIHTHTYFSQTFSNCSHEAKFALGLIEHAALLKRALPPLTKLCGVAVVISSYLSVKRLPCFITASHVFYKAFCSTLGY